MRGKQRITAYDIKEEGFMRGWKEMHRMEQNGDTCSDHDLGPVARQKTTDEQFCLSYNYTFIMNLLKTYCTLWNKK